MRYPKLRELKEAIKALIKGPCTTKFPIKPHYPYERFRGKPEFHQQDCVGCGACAQVCPTGAIQIKELRTKKKISIHWDLCIFCGNCQLNCLTGKGVLLSNEFDLATTGKREGLFQEIEKKIISCQCCKENVACYDHLIWVANRLGPLSYSNSSLLLLSLADLGLALSEDSATKSVGQDLLRSDRIKILCPRCRRKAVTQS